MNCEDCNQRLLDYAYEELDAPDRAAVEEALARCPQCREDLAAIRTQDRSGPNQCLAFYRRNAGPAGRGAD